jgi:hypothetical protein
MARHAPNLPWNEGMPACHDFLVHLRWEWPGILEKRRTKKLGKAGKKRQAIVTTGL